MATEIKITIPSVSSFMDQFNIEMSEKKFVRLSLVVLLEFLVIIILMCVYRMDCLHKVTLARIEKMIRKQEAEHEKRVIELGIKTKSELVDEVLEDQH